jgi:hypothetical protein
VQHTLAAPWSPASDRGIYGFWIAVVWAAMLGGFGLDFARYMGETPPPPFILHFHAAVYVFWLGLVTCQILWIETGNPPAHRHGGVGSMASAPDPSGGVIRCGRALDR